MMTSRAMLSALIALCGLALLAYGLAVHRAPVLVEQEVAPASPAVAQPATPAVPAPFFAPPPPPPSPIAEKVLVVSVEPEQRLVRDVTVGGLTRLGGSRIKRTYSGDGPALCPT
jgi:hypothetical protein